MGFPLFRLSSTRTSTARRRTTPGARWRGHEPMGVVIFFGTIITMLLILTVLPVAYWLMIIGTTKKRLASETIEQE